MKKRITLFVRGRNFSNDLMQRRLDDVCQRRFGDGYELAMVNVLEQPQMADAAQIVATPALLWSAPEPQWRVVGDSASLERALQAVAV